MRRSSTSEGVALSNIGKCWLALASGAAAIGARSTGSGPWVTPVWLVKRVVMAALAIWVVAAAGCADSQRALSPSRAAAIADSVQGAIALYLRYMSAGQWDSVVSLYGTDSSFRWIESGQRYHGGTIRRTLMSAPIGTHVETKYDSTEVVALAPGLALVTTYYNTQMSGPMAAHFGGAISMVWSHQPDGWRLIGGHSSSGAARPSQ
jgi:hypothetical protein